MSGWIFRVDEKDYPAENLDDLRAWAREGRVQPSHYVYNPNLQKWLYAKDIEELRIPIAQSTTKPAPTGVNRPFHTWVVWSGILALVAWHYWDQPNPFGIDPFTFAPLVALVAGIIAIIGARRNSRRSRGLA